MAVDDEGNGEEDLEAAAERETEAAIEAAMDVALDAQRERDAELQSELADQWYDDETEPWADPDIQKGYQAALGGFIVEFNRLDAELTKILRLTLGHVGKLGLFSRYRQSSYGAKLLALELLQTNRAIKNIHYAPIDEMRKISAIRNFLAHAHFDQNPFDGTYILVPPKSDKASDEMHLKEDAIRKWAVRTAEACHQLGYCEMPYVFADVRLSESET